MKKLLLVYLLAIAIQTQAQNVGIGNPTPTEKLDVTGNINVTGTIKANGVDGTAGQVLMKNQLGILTWSDGNEYKNFQMFNYTTAGSYQQFTIPAGVTKVKVQAWGGGGWADSFESFPYANAGGSGGGYAEGVLTVSPGTILFVRVARYNDLGASTEFSHVYNVSPTNAIKAFSGLSSMSSGGGTLVGIPYGGVGSKDGTVYNFFSMQGESGKPSTTNYFQAGATTFYTSMQHGNGGDGANAPNTGAIGGQLIYNGTSIISQVRSGQARVPGGGASATSLAGPAYGRVIIYW